MEYLVRPARITDIDRMASLCREQLQAARSNAGDGGPLDPGDLLRQMVFLPQASVFVAETRRELAGLAVLTLRPSVRAGGYVGTVDLLAVDEDRDVEHVTDTLIEEVLRSAANKGCVVVEAAFPADADEQARWDRHGFRGTGPSISRRVESRANRPAAGGALRTRQTS